MNVLKKIEPVLVANRGEIAARVIRTCKAHGIRVYALRDVRDKTAVYAREADRVIDVHHEFRDAEEILTIAKRHQAGSIHPGYGFFAENADFAQQVEAAGITFIGPNSSVIRQMGDKGLARELAEKAGVPVLTGVPVTSRDSIAPVAGIGFPILLKATAGGGGKGMRVVTKESDLAAEIESLQKEATRLYGNASIIAEKYLTDCRHVEVQIMGNCEGKNFALFDRDCSLQRNNQKIIEEAPAPGIPDEVRTKMKSSAVQLANNVGYKGAGTIEFLYDPSAKSFYFLEMNTRLQVEHTVTEQITGLDLVLEQLKTAAGIPAEYADVAAEGAAIEARICAELPDSTFRPSAGVIFRYLIPQTLPGIRIDSGVGEGSEISAAYDNMIAKVIATAPNRREAATLLRDALSQVVILGVHTNIPLLRHLLDSEMFLEQKMHTKAILPEIQNLGEPPDSVGIAAILEYLREQQTHSKDIEGLKNFQLFNEPKIFFNDLTKEKEDSL